MDEIRQHCALMMSDDLATHTMAYLWLRECKPFRRVLDRFREYDLNVFDVAAMLATGSTRPMTRAAVRMLAEEVAAECQ
jgi:hypothetical protein